MNVPNSPAVELTREPVQGPSVATRGHRPSVSVTTVDDGGHWGCARSLLRRHAVIIQSIALESVANDRSARPLRESSTADQTGQLTWSR